MKQDMTVAWQRPRKSPVTVATPWEDVRSLCRPQQAMLATVDTRVSGPAGLSSGSVRTVLLTVSPRLAARREAATVGVTPPGDCKLLLKRVYFNDWPIKY